MTDMGTFRTDVELENPRNPGVRQVIRHALVDTGAELSWFPRSVLEQLGVTRLKLWHFRQADGTVLERWTAVVMVSVLGVQTVDEVVLGEPHDLVLLGARSLEGLNLRVEPATKRLVDAGPAPAAACACTKHDRPVARIIPEGRTSLAATAQAVQSLRALQARIAKRTRGRAVVRDADVRDAIDRGRL